MPIDATGNPVQVYPVENYPLGVKASWAPTQVGSGDPSPDNIRPISGKNAISVTRCGKNYIDVKSLDKKAISSCKYESTEKGFRVTAYAPGAYKPCLFYLPTDIVLGKTITVSEELTAKTNDVTPGIRIIAYKDGYVQQAVYVDRDFGSVGVRYSVTVKIPDALPEGCEGFALNYYCTKDTNANKGDYSEYADSQIELGSTATPYEPYTGSTTDIALPETVYGGTLDVETGVVNTTWGHIASYAGEALPGEWISDRDVYSSGAVPTTGAQVVYKLKTPYTIQLTKQQIAVLSGVNTFYTDAGALTVTGREDPRHTIVTLTDRIAALESAAAGV